MEYKTFKVSELITFERRDIRSDVVEKLKERIEAGFNPARPLTVIIKDGKNLVADGNHRLQVLRELGIETVPCVIREGNEYTIAIECNNDEETYAPEDLFDRLNTIEQLKSQDYTQAEIGEIVGMSREQIRNHVAVIDKVGTIVLDLAKQYQEGRVPQIGTNVPFNFTEGWFRNSGIYDLCYMFKIRLMEDFIADKFNWNSQKVQSVSAKYKLWQEMIEITKDGLHDENKAEELIEMIKNDVFKTVKQLKDKIDTLNIDAKNRLICGDCILELENLQDGSIDIVITDPPYGIDYKSNFGKYSDGVAKEGLLNDDKQAIEIFEKVCDVLSRKTKENAHLYFFIDVNNYPAFRTIAEVYFDVRTPLIWYKSDGGIGDLQYDWINGTEMVIYCTKGNKKVNKRRVNVLKFDRLHSSKMIHPTQKPEELITEILTVSANKYDVFCDPFMGSGSHIRSAKAYGCNYIGIELDRVMYEKAKANIGG